MGLLLGIDIGSTTVKAVLQDNGNTLYSTYRRHMSQVHNKTIEILNDIKKEVGNRFFSVAISGSAGLGLAQDIEVAFVQEVYATSLLVRNLHSETDCVIELGGEDAKIIFFDGGIDERMNGSCAGGTGAFIDQMATLLDVSVDELDALSLKHTRVYPIASRCGVFAKTDIQPLLNQGAKKEDIAASIYQSVVNQTIAGLAQGKAIRGTVLFLGGPLYYCKGLQNAFVKTLELDDNHAIFPEYARVSVALGASIYAKSTDTNYTVDDLIAKIKNCKAKDKVGNRMPCLFRDKAEYENFCSRHKKSTLPAIDISQYKGKAFLGIDCGSTTTKLVLISENKELLYTFYSSNKGTPVDIVKEQLCKLYDVCGDNISICGSAVTGYGEDLIRNAFGVDIGVVETIAHYNAAKHFNKDVDFILDIGGQDIKCFKIINGAIDSIMLNEACSSGCGSFLETFAKSMNYSISDFAKLGLHSKEPVNLGSRCTVFMNSSVKQAQKDGATIEDISAGLAIAVIKNALYKVIRTDSAETLGENIVVQGGTFHNDAVLRAFEMELGHNVIRPNISGLMGAFGAAIISMRCSKSTILSKEELLNFTRKSTSALCNGCTNHCHITVNIFSGNKKFISGNQCEKALGSSSTQNNLPNLYEYKRNYLTSLPRGNNTRGRIGIPLALGMYELLPLWNGIFTKLGFEVVKSKMSSRRTYEKGQFTIPSDTACYPAKLMHGHIEELLEEDVDAIFYPCLSYNIDEKGSDNHYNCPVVAYYSELLSGNIDKLNTGNTKFLYPYLNINSLRPLSRKLYEVLNNSFCDISYKEVKAAVKYGFQQYYTYMSCVREKGAQAINFARENNKRIMILSGRPYHIDSQIGHGIDKLATSLGFVVVSEDSVFELTTMPEKLSVLNQWTYHSRLYRAAKYATEHKDVELVQLVSFGCGVDAITTDEVRKILESKNKLYTQIKIDEITNLGAVKIRLRSLLGAIEERERKNGTSQ